MTKQNYSRWLMAIYVIVTSSLLGITLMALIGHTKFSVELNKITSGRISSPPHLTEIDRARSGTVAEADVITVPLYLRKIR